MASTSQEQLYELFAAIAGTQNGMPVSPVDVVNELQPSASNAPSYRQPLGPGGGSGSGGGSGGGGVGSIFSDVFGTGLGIMPMVSGLMSLFGGGGPAPEPVLQHYQMPAPIAFEGADMGGAIVAADYGQGNVARLFGNYGASGVSTSAAAPEAGASSFSTPSSAPAGASNATAAAAPQINVTVQAMDARSFLDRSSDIAAAVRDAMLNMNSINDVVTDL